MKHPRILPERHSVVMLMAAALLAVGGCVSGNDGAQSQSSEAVDLPDLTDCPAPSGTRSSGAEVLPRLELPCLDSDGGQFVVGEAPGVPMVLNLWASWCGPCRTELPHFIELYAQADPAELLIAGVITRDSAELAAELAVDLGINFPNGLDENGDLYVDQGLRGLPGTFFLNADGSIAHSELAPIATYDGLVELVGQHLGVSL